MRLDRRWVDEAGSESLRRLRLAQAVVVASAGLFLVAALVSAGEPFGIRSSAGRILLEVAGFCMVAFAAVILSLPGEEDVRPARNAFVAALVTLAVTNAVFTLWPVVAGGRLGVDRGIAYYPWLAGRYLAGAWFVAAGLDRPRASLARVLAAALGLLLLVEVVVATFGPALPVPDRLLGTGDGPSLEPVGHVVLQLFPAALFGLGALLAMRLHGRSGAPAHWWLSIALTLQVFAQFHEARFPSALGPTITAADAHRLAAFLCLLTGAVLQLRTAYRAAARTVRVQQDDLQAREHLVEELRRFAEQEQAFRSIVSHELETPLATIRAYAHLLDGDLPGAPPVHRRAVEGIQGESRRLSELVARLDELRDLELTSFACELRPTPLRALLEDGSAFVAGLPGRHPVSVETVDVRVMADPVRVGQALRNLLANATRYAAPGTPVSVEGRFAGEERVLLRVRDHGPGIPVDERERVRERYVRGRGAADVEGSGLGLYVATRIAEAHGGELDIEDAPGGGTVVSFTLGVAS